MTTQSARWWAVLGTMALWGLSMPAFAQAPKAKTQAAERYTPTDAERKEIEARAAELARALEALPRHERDTYADVAVYHKAAAWALREGEFHGKKDVAATLKVIALGLDRARAASDGRKPWLQRPGSLIRGYLSRVDGSVQPYAVIVPEALARAGAGRSRLDVVLHGRGATLNEVNFIQAHDGKPTPDDSKDFLTLHVFGRTNNAYRWAGETDVFEAIEAVKRNYSVDERRVVLRGFSMGGAGAWHLGLHHPGVWVAAEAGAGFSETKQYTKAVDLPDYQEKALHIYDAVDVAGNAFNVPIAGYGGEIDPQRQASLNILEALETLGYAMKTDGLVTRGEGIDFLRVVGAQTAHKVDPESAKILRAFRDEHAAKGLDFSPKAIKFTTYTLKYPECFWLTIEQLREHYQRAVVEAEVHDKRVIIRKVENVAILSVERHMAETIEFGTQEFPLESAVKGLLPNVYFRSTEAGWEQLDYAKSRAFQENVERGKRHHIQGPIDDAFTGPFLCVRGTGTPWNPPAQQWADARLERFRNDWRAWLRGEVRVKDDTEVTAEDIADHNLVLFGDPGSNRVLARVLKDLPIGWTKAEINLGARGTFAAADHVPVLIAPNPINPLRYVVVNSGHSFGAKEFAGTNALLYPHLGDFAVFSAADTKPGAAPKVSGYFDEKWKLSGTR